MGTLLREQSCTFGQVGYTATDCIQLCCGYTVDTAELYVWSCRVQYYRQYIVVLWIHCGDNRAVYLVM